ncbi:MAG TPA: glycosyltransferase [Terrimicrobiaceae bacterium]
MHQQSVGIGITTKDRWDDLSVTLERLRQNALDRFETIVIDDGSSRPMPPGFPRRFDWVKFERCESSRGYIAQRNRLAQMLSSELYLSLDDDSYPASLVPLDHAAAWLLGREDAVGLAFSIQTPFDKRDNLPALGAAPYPVRFYIGCAHMLKRELFCRLGGYTESLFYYCEEIDFALKAWKHKFKVYKYSSVVVCHDMSPSGRNAANANRFFTRNDIWISFWRSPYPIFILHLFIRLPMILRYRTHRLHWKAVVRGYLDAVVGLLRVARYRDPLSFRQYVAWLNWPKEFH